jgi:hypothetical protein
MNDTRPDERSPSTPGVRYERTDISLPRLLVFLAICGTTTVFVFVAVTAIFVAYTGDAATSRHGPALSSAELGPLPAEPILEGLVEGQQVQASLPPDDFGWVDRKRNVARIPVETAMDLLADRLPARSDDSTPTESPAPTDSNSGRTRKGLP